MGWIIKALCKKILQIIDSLMAWTAALVTNLKLDIGMDDDASTALTIINPTTAGENSLLYKVFPGAAGYCKLFMALAIILIFIIVIFKLYQGFVSPFVNAEPPAGVLLGGFLASFGVASSYTIFVAFEKIFNVAFTGFMNKFSNTVSKADFHQFQDSLTEAEQKELIKNGTYQDFKDFSNDGSTSSSHVNEFWGSDKLINPNPKYDKGDPLHTSNITGGGNGDGFSLIIIECMLGIAIVTAFVKLVAEIYQRYITLGLLFYTCPLAFAMLASKSTRGIMSSWFQMLFSQFILMCMNLFFVGTFIGAFMNLLQSAEGGYYFNTDVEFVTTMLLLLGWLVVGQRVDEYMRSLGLSVANTGAGLGGALLAGAMTTMGGMKTLGRMGTRAVSKGAGAAHDAYMKAHAPEVTNKGELAKDSLSAAAVGEMSGDALRQNVADRGGLPAGVNANDVDWNASAAASGMGAEVLMSSDGNVLSERAVVGSLAAERLAEGGLYMDNGDGTISGVTGEQFNSLRENLINDASNGSLRRSDGSIDRTKYNQIYDDGGTSIAFAAVDKNGNIANGIDGKPLMTSVDVAKHYGLHGSLADGMGYKRGSLAEWASGKKSGSKE